MDSDKAQGWLGPNGILRHWVEFGALSLIVSLGVLSIIATNGPTKSWKVVHTLTEGPSYSKIWGSGPNDIWVYGPRDSMLHWNGTSWSTVAVATGAGNKLEDMWGAAPNDIWAVGDIVGNVLHWNGSSWSKVALPDPFPSSDYRKYPMHGVAGTATNDVWIVGEFQKILRWNGSAWNIVGQENANRTLMGTWALSPADAWATVIGTGGEILHWNGSTWSPVAIPAGVISVWGAASNDVWAAGGSGTLLHWNGSAWSKVESGTTMILTNVFGSGANDVWVVGNQTHTLHWNGSAWTRVSAPSALLDVWTSEPGKAWGVAGRTILRYE
jgi:hypothetical protein